jgi:hypothetical protein
VDGRVPDAWQRRDSVVRQSLTEFQIASLSTRREDDVNQFADDAFVIPERYTSEVWGGSD